MVIYKNTIIQRIDIMVSLLHRNKKLLRGGGVKINKGIDDIPLLKRNIRIFLTKTFADVKVIEKENVPMILTMS